MGDRLLALRERLLLAGISPHHVERYLRELSEHRNDIAEHFLESGLSHTEAHKRADQRMGDDDLLVFPMLTDRRFRSHAARWPAVFYMALPLIVQMAFIFGGVLALICAAGTSLRPVVGDLGTGLALIMLASPVVIAWMTLLAAMRRRAALRWPVLGAFALALLGSTLQMAITPPYEGTPGKIGLVIGSPHLLVLITMAFLSLLPLVLQQRPE